VLTITEHVAAIAPLIHSVRPQRVDERSLLRWSITTTMSVLGVSRTEALDFVRRATNR
jgi:hypothetical protein